MRKALILPLLLLAFGAQSARAQGKGPVPDGPTGAPVAERAKDARKVQPAEQAEAPAESPKSDSSSNRKQTEEPLVTSTTASMTLNEEANTSAATSDAPTKTTPIVPVAPSSTESGKAAAPAPKEEASKKAAPAKAANSKENTSKKRVKNEAARKNGPRTDAAPTTPASTIKDAAKDSAGAATKENAPAASSASTPATVGPASPAQNSGQATAQTSTQTPAQNSTQPASVTAASTSAASAPAAAPLPTNIYRIGAGDVLDVRLLNAPSRESTLFTVMPGGLLEYPLAGAPVQVGGLTTEEIAARLASAVKVYDNPRFVVNVREYASHSVIVTGLVANPGPRILRREAMPLYVVLAESQPHAEAARATIMRTGAQNLTVDLSDSAATATLVQSGDVIKVSAAPPAPPQYYFIGGLINIPGQKDFHQGLTLTQAILASGGTAKNDNTKLVRVSRQGADGRLVTTEYNLKLIEEGKVPDPLLQPGDRVEIGRGRW